MIEKRVEGLLTPEQNRRLLVIDKCGFSGCFDYARLLRKHGFEIHRYENAEAFRVLYEESLKAGTEKVAVIVPFIKVKEVK
jgi:hypothetical protein